MTQQVYTIGYGGRTPAEIEQLAQDLDATVFDIRFSPRSRDPRWSRKQLGELLDSRYRHVRELGNVNYKGGPIELVDFDAGRELIEQSDRPVILMCVCRDPRICHRTVVAHRLREAGLSVTEIGQQALFLEDPHV
jgi:uncharacterized protein (DUF488 family)